MGGQKYAELLCDFMFKRLFGSEANKDVLIGFPNMLQKDVEIENVDFIPTEHMGRYPETCDSGCNSVGIH